MSTQYPNSLDILTNPEPTDRLDSVAVPHHKQHADANDAIEAIQTTLGVNPAGVHLTVKDRIISIEGTVQSQSVLNGLNDVTITTVADGDILRYTGSEWVNYPEENLVDGGNF
jgi:hypothetical protein